MQNLFFLLLCMDSIKKSHLYWEDTMKFAETYVCIFLKRKVWLSPLYLLLFYLFLRWNFRETSIYFENTTKCEIFLFASFIYQKNT